MNENIISAIFDSYREASAAVHDLRDAGAKDEQLSIIVRQNGSTRQYDGSGDEVGSKAGSAIVGAAGGAAVGTVLGLAALAIPGIGPFAAAGAIAAAAVPEAAAIGAGAGALAGGVSGLLKTHGVSDEDYRYYQDRIKGGAVFVSVDARKRDIRPDVVRDILFRHGGHNASRPRVETRQ